MKEKRRDHSFALLFSFGLLAIFLYRSKANLAGFWLGGVRLMMNAIFFGKIIDAASGRTD